MHERQITELWQQLSPAGTVLSTTDNEPVTIIYPGRANPNRGADFCDAVIATSRGVVTGDIEVHVNSADWRAHGHHHNPDYDRVVLHVVWQHTAVTGTRGNSGRHIPTVALDKCFPELSPQHPRGSPAHTRRGYPMRCAGGDASKRNIEHLLDRAGDERFALKCQQFHHGMIPGDASQRLYQGLMAALGYSQNQLPFTELARRLPLPLIESALHGLPDADYLTRQQALLLGTAGLLPSQRHLHLPDADTGNDYIDKLETQWAASPPTPVLSPNAWNLFRVRPGNLPLRRLLAMSHLLLRYRTTGLLTGIVQLINGAPPERYPTLAAGLTVPASGYWSRHLDFGMSSSTATPALLGTSRAADMVVNVLLPFTLAWGQLHEDMALAEKCRTLYRQYPRLTTNSMEQHMIAQLCLDSRRVNSARRQQGLLHIYKTLCTQGKCGACPLATLKSA